MAHYFPNDVKFGLLADSRSFLANQKARNAIVGAENLLNADSNEESPGVTGNPRNAMVCGAPYLQNEFGRDPRFFFTFLI